MKICEDKLLDLDPYNRLMTASLAKGGTELPKRVGTVLLFAND